MITLKKVIVETQHPSPFALSSHLSALIGHICGLKIGVRMGVFEGLGMQAEDCPKGSLVSDLQI